MPTTMETDVNHEAVDKVKEMIKDIETAMLSTISEGGHQLQADADAGY